MDILIPGHEKGLHPAKPALGFSATTSLAESGRLRSIDRVLSPSLDLASVLEYVKKWGPLARDPGVLYTQGEHTYTVVWSQEVPDGKGHGTLLRLNSQTLTLEAYWFSQIGTDSEEKLQKILSVSKAQANNKPIGFAAFNQKGIPIEIGINQINERQTPVTNFINTFLTHSLRGPFT
jgi:hypothetical protein